MRSHQRRLTVGKVLVALVGIFLVCVGVAFNNNTLLGNDPVGLIYDGIRVTFHVAQINLGLVSNVINVVLLILLFMVGRHYANVGSLMYLIPYGTFVLLGSHLYRWIFTNDALSTRVLGGVVGISLYYLGISLFICTDIGVDPFSGFMLTLRDYLHWSLRKTKICFDLVLIVIGFLLGGKVGGITLVTVATTGPAIQFLSTRLAKILNFASETEGES